MVPIRLFPAPTHGEPRREGGRVVEKVRPRALSAVVAMASRALGQRLDPDNFLTHRPRIRAAT
jgi:hypothetical protein